MKHLSIDLNKSAVVLVIFIISLSYYVSPQLAGSATDSDSEQSYTTVNECNTTIVSTITEYITVNRTITVYENATTLYIESDRDLVLYILIIVTLAISLSSLILLIMQSIRKKTSSPGEVIGL